MPNQFTLQDCIDLATFAHRHQFDKAGEPYVKHPLRVLASVQAVGAPAYVQMAAVLHDVTEDTPFTCEMLVKLGVPVAAVEVIQLVDRGYSENVFKNRLVVGAFNPETYNDDRDAFYYAGIKASPGALIVKKADIGDNTQPWRLEYLSKETQDRLRDKYKKALDSLS